MLVRSTPTTSEGKVDKFCPCRLEQVDLPSVFHAEEDDVLKEHKAVAASSDLADANCAAVAESSSRTDLKPSSPHCASEISTHCVCSVIDSANRASYRRFREKSSKERTQEEP